jgi:hypothetical protein
LPAQRLFSRLSYSDSLMCARRTRPIHDFGQRHHFPGAPRYTSRRSGLYFADVLKSQQQ